MQSEVTRKSQSEQENCERHQVPVQTLGSVNISQMYPPVS